MALKAELREKTGTGSAKKLRREGLVPVSMYGKDSSEAISLAVDRREFEQILREHGANAVFTVEYDGKEQQVWVKDFEYGVLKDELYFIDLEAISANQKLEVEIPVHIVNEETVKQGTVELILQEVVVETTPANIPQNFEVDVTGLEIGDTLEVSVINLPEGVTLVTEADETLISVSAPMEEPEEIDPDAEVAEPEVIGETEADEEE